MFCLPFPGLLSCFSKSIKGQSWPGGSEPCLEPEQHSAQQRALDDCDTFLPCTDRFGVFCLQSTRSALGIFAADPTAGCSHSHVSIPTDVFCLPPCQVRQVSNEIVRFPPEQLQMDQQRSLIFMQWGQFIDHDLDFSPETPARVPFGGETDCDTSCAKEPPCFPIQVLLLLPGEEGRGHLPSDQEMLVALLVLGHGGTSFQSRPRRSEHSVWWQCCVLGALSGFRHRHRLCQISRRLPISLNNVVFLWSCSAKIAQVMPGKQEMSQTGTGECQNPRKIHRT